MGCVSVCLVLLLGSAFASTTELLYVQERQNLVTYSVNNTTADTRRLGSLFLNATNDGRLQIFRSGSFIYVLGFNAPATEEWFSVHALTSEGVPTLNSIQKLAVKPTLKQFYIHPNGTIAYALFSWTEIIHGRLAYASDIVLFTINPKTGKLTNTTKVVANFPGNSNWMTSIYGLDSEGTKLYTEALYVGSSHKAGIVYDYATVNAKTGALGKLVQFWFDDNLNEVETSVFSDALIAQVRQTDFGSRGSGIGVYSNSTSPVKLISCYANNLPVCGDLLGQPWMHPSGKYIFVYDATTFEVPILYISTALKKLVPSGASIPGNPQ